MHLDDFHFVGDLVILSDTHQHMQVKTVSSVAASAPLGLNIHMGKSMNLKYNTENASAVTLDGETMEEVESFTYMVSIIDQHGGSGADVNAGIGKTSSPLLQLKYIWNSK